MSLSALVDDGGETLVAVMNGAGVDEDIPPRSLASASSSCACRSFSASCDTV